MRRKVIGATLVAAAVGVLGLLAPVTWAQETASQATNEKWYQVEVIVFERLGRSGLDAEAWDPDPGHPPIEESIALIAPGESPQEGPGPHAFRILPADALTMGKIRGHLENARDMRPILHVAWRQPGVIREDAQWVNLYLPPHGSSTASTSDTFLGMARRVGAQDLGNTSQPMLVPLDALQAPTVVPPVLDGSIRVHLARYLHAEVDLLYHRDGVDTRFRLLESRRMRSGELHYLDHPVFGILVKVIPFEPEKSN